jgi:hypothetical protein
MRAIGAIGPALFLKPLAGFIHILKTLVGEVHGGSSRLRHEYSLNPCFVNHIIVDEFLAHLPLFLVTPAKA